ncbi:MAG: hypothetical protein IJ503_02090 [Akkermansia sp.]|nr:hypothetical protein [Akkermansia sp.]
MMDASELATKMMESGYKFNKIVKLISCNTGSLKDGFAQELANHLYAIWKKSYQYIKNPHIIIAAPDTLTEIEYINNDGVLSYKVYPAGEFGGYSFNSETNELTYISPPEIIYKTFTPCK